MRQMAAETAEKYRVELLAALSALPPVSPPQEKPCTCPTWRHHITGQPLVAKDCPIHGVPQETQADRIERDATAALTSAGELPGVPEGAPIQRSDAFMWIGEYCRHKDGCEQLKGTRHCSCGLMTAQNKLLSALYQVPLSASPGVVPRAVPDVRKRAIEWIRAVARGEAPPPKVDLPMVTVPVCWLEHAAEIADRLGYSEPHQNPDDCPTYYDGCHCTVENLVHNIERAEKAEAELALIRAVPDPPVGQTKDNDDQARTGEPENATAAQLPQGRPEDE